MSAEPRRIRVLALVPYPIDTTPSQRFRIEQWAPLLRADGIDVDFSPFADADLMARLHRPGGLVAKAGGMLAGVRRRIAELDRVLDYDVVFVHRAISLVGPPTLERIVARRRPMMLDFDDAIYKLHTSGANRLFGWLKFPGKTATICRLSACVVVGSEYLAGYARRYNERTVVVPTSIDTDLYQPRPRPGPSSRLVVGWTGSGTSMTHLEAFAPMLRRLQEEVDAEIRVLSNRAPELPGVRFVFRPWNAETEIEEIRQFDIGIKPMPDDEWARGKCPMKELQYMALGIPAISSAVGTSFEAIDHGRNGLLAASTEDWIAGVRQLAQDASLRERMGACGRRTVVERYSARACAARFADAVRRTLGGHA